MAQSKSTEAGFVRDCLAGGGEMGALMRAMDWSKTGFGRLDHWSSRLQMMVSYLLANRFPLLLWWADQYSQIYDDRYQPLMGDKRPKFIGQPAGECFPEVWHIIRPYIEALRWLADASDAAGVAKAVVTWMR